jgi:hypothetical protein
VRGEGVEGVEGVEGGLRKLETSAGSVAGNCFVVEKCLRTFSSRSKRISSSLFRLPPHKKIRQACGDREWAIKILITSVSL